MVSSAGWNISRRVGNQTCSAQATYRAAYLASSVEYLRYSMSHLENREDELEWIGEAIAGNLQATQLVKRTIREMVIIFESYGDVLHTGGKYNWISRVERVKDGKVETDLGLWLHQLIFVHTKPLQHIFYDAIMAPMSNDYVHIYLNDPGTSDGEKARFRSTSAQHAGKWLAAIPKEGFRMHSNEFKTAVLLRLGMQVVKEDLVTCLCSTHATIDTLGVHLLSCNKGNQIGNRHKYITDYFVDLMKAAKQSTTTEVHLNVNSNSSNGGERSDITLKRQTLFAGRTRHQHFDVTVINPSAPSYTRTLRTSKENGTAARRAHQNKIKKYSSLVDKEDFHPLVMETYGCWTDEVTSLIKTCCNIISEEKRIEYSVLVNYWTTKLSFILQWENAIIILEREKYLSDETLNGRPTPGGKVYRGRKFYELRTY